MVRYGILFLEHRFVFGKVVYKVVKDLVEVLDEVKVGYVWVELGFLGTGVLVVLVSKYHGHYHL